MDIFTEDMRGKDPIAHRLISRDAFNGHRETGNRFVHPWLRDIGAIPPGMFLLIYGLLVVTSTAYHSPFESSEDPTPISPLASQPLVERALTIPSYVHILRGQDRALARAAFASDLAPLVLRRTGKAGPDFWIERVVENNRNFLTEFLGNGVLAQHRILDRAKLSAILGKKISSSIVPANEIIAQLYIEAWLKKWDKMNHQVAA